MTIYFGTVEDRAGDVAKACRYRVRVIGVHSPLKSDIPTEDLPWALPLQNDSAAMSGVGNSATGYLNGSLVAVMFVDEELQTPVILGAVGGVPNGSSYNGLELFSSVNADIGIIPPLSPRPNLIKFSDGTTKNPSEVSNVPANATIVEQGYIGNLTASDVRKLIPVIAKHLTGNNQFTSDAWGYGAYLHSKDDLIKLGYLSSDGVTWLGQNKIASETQYLQSTGTQYDAEETLLKLYYTELRKLQIVSEKTPKEKLAGLLLASHKGGTYKTYEFVETGIDFAGHFDAYVEGYKTIAGKTTTEQPTRTNIDEDASDKHEVYTDTSKSKFDVKAEKNPINNQGFADPDGVYPLPSHDGEPDTPRLASGIKVNETIVGLKATVVVKKATVANSSVTWKQSPIPYNAIYPHNKVYQSPSGHVMEFDDTKGSERVHIAHRTGTFWEVDNAGNAVDRTMGTRTIIVDKDELVYVKGSGHILVDGDVSLKVNRAIHIEVAGDVNLKVGGNVTQKVAGDYSLDVGGKFTVKSSSIDMEGSSSFNLNSTALLFKSPTIKMNPWTGDIMFAGHSMSAGTASPKAIPEFNPTIEIPAPITREDIQSIELEDTTSSKALLGAVIPVKNVEEDNKQPSNPLAAIVSKNKMVDDITYQTRLSANYTIRDLAVGQLGSNFPFDGQHNLTAKDIANNLKALCLNCIEPIREQFIDKGFRINSGIRPAGNPASIEGRISQHELGQAADISFSKIRGKADDRQQFYEIAKWIRDNILFDQLLLEYRSGGQVWIHITFNTKGNRRIVKTMNNDSTYKEGLALLV